MDVGGTAVCSILKHARRKNFYFSTLPTRRRRRRRPRWSVAAAARLDQCRVARAAGPPSGLGE